MFLEIMNYISTGFVVLFILSSSFFSWLYKRRTDYQNWLVTQIERHFEGLSPFMTFWAEDVEFNQHIRNAHAWLIRFEQQERNADGYECLLELKAATLLIHEGMRQQRLA